MCYTIADARPCTSSANQQLSSSSYSDNDVIPATAHSKVIWQSLCSTADNYAELFESYEHCNTSLFNHAFKNWEEMIYIYF